MPELPEVETVARSLRQLLGSAGLAAVELRRPDMLRGRPEHFAALAGCRIAAIHRAGKLLIFDLAPGGPSAATRWQLGVHLGMTGSLCIFPAGAPLQSHTHAILQLDDGRELRLRDPRRFGRLAVAAAGEPPAALGLAGGREPLEIDAADFVALFRGRRAPIKNLLLNQKLLRGVGNIYADESLHRAGIDPRARLLSQPRLRRLRLALRQVLEEAIAAGGSSIADYVSGDGRRGWFQLRHRVYGRQGRPCRRCGAVIRRCVLAGRSAHFCPGCQRR